MLQPRVVCANWGCFNLPLGKHADLHLQLLINSNPKAPWSQDGGSAAG